MTKIIGNLTLNNIDFMEVCYELEIDKDRLEYMRSLSEKVKELGVYEVSVFDSRLDAYQDYLDPDLTQDKAEAALVGFKDQRLDCVLLHVSEDEFKYTGYLKNTDIYFSTGFISFEEIENNDFIFNPE